MTILTQKRLKELLDYNPITGTFTSLTARSGPKKKSGEEPGYLNGEGYRVICVDGKQYRAHRLAYLYMEGYLPEHDVDHQKGIRHDNRWKEIRHATRSCNQQNRKISKNNASGFPGVSWHTKSEQWRASACLNNKTQYLGMHKTAIDAALARLTWELNTPEWECNYRSELVKAIEQTGLVLNLN